MSKEYNSSFSEGRAVVLSERVQHCTLSMCCGYNCRNAQPEARFTLPVDQNSPIRSRKVSRLKHIQFYRAIFAAAVKRIEWAYLQCFIISANAISMNDFHLVCPNVILLIKVPLDTTKTLAPLRI